MDAYSLFMYTFKQSLNYVVQLNDTFSINLFYELNLEHPPLTQDIHFAQSVLFRRNADNSAGSKKFNNKSL